MARRALPLLLLLAVVAALAVAAAPVHASTADDGEDEVWLGGGGGGGTRRWLQDLNNGTANATDSTTAGFISYGALSADTVPCPVAGASYYNCRVGAEANPYERGCSAIARCRD